MKNADNKGNGIKRNRKRWIWMIVLSVVALLLIVVGIKAYRILYTPQDLFKFSTINPALLATGTHVPKPEPETGNPDADTAAPAAVSTPAPTPGIAESKDILNVLLIGVDRRAAANGGDSKGTNGGRNGTDPHADVQMIVAINFKEKRADLISIPRDTFIYNPDLMNGVYKINATFNVGGGFTDANGGFRRVCDGAQYMLGGIPVDYYYAVDFEALVKLVDAIGGVDFAVDSASYSRKHKKGMQHMDGQDVLFYVRNRKAGPEQGDLNRINRQKDMMVAIFTQLKEKGKLSMVPDLINAANSGVYTNTNLEQTLALANFARTIDSKNIGMHSMVGAWNSTLGWSWYFTNQKKRMAVIKAVYGIDVPEQAHCSVEFAHWLASYGFRGMVYLETAKQVLDYAEAHKSELTDEQKSACDELAATHTEVQKAWDLASLTFESSDNHSLIDGESKLKSGATSLAKQLGYPEALQWTYDTRVPNNWVFEKKINEFFVDFH